MVEAVGESGHVRLWSVQDDEIVEQDGRKLVAAVIAGNELPK